MSTQKYRNTAIFAALHTHYLNNGTGTYTYRRNDYALIKFAPFLGGILLCIVCGILLAMFMLMRERKKRIQEATSLANLPWIDTLEVFAVNDREGAPGVFLPLPGPVTVSPPPAYETVIKVSEKDKEANEEKEFVPPPMRTPSMGRLPPLSVPPAAAAPPDDLPTYDAAVKQNENV